MSYSIVYPHGEAISIAVPSGAAVAVKTKDTAKVYQIRSNPNFPDLRDILMTVNDGESVSAVFSAAGTIEIEANASEVRYSIGVDAKVWDGETDNEQAVPGTLNATGALTAALMNKGIVTSTTGSNVTATLPTGTVMDLSNSFDIGDSFDWTAINTGGNTFTVTAATGHTIVGGGAVATTSDTFRTKKTAANTFVTYRLT